MSNSTGLTFTFVGAKTYNAPTGKVVNPSWQLYPTVYQFGSDTYTYPNPNTLLFSRVTYRELLAQGADSYIFGTAKVAGTQTVHVLPSSEFYTFGSIRIEYTQFLKPTAFDSQVAPHATKVYLPAAFIRPSLIWTLEFGENVVQGFRLWEYAPNGIFGNPMVKDVAQGIHVKGINAGAMGFHGVSPKEGGGDTNFIFTQPYTIKPTATNVGLYFGSTIPVFPKGEEPQQVWGAISLQKTPDIRPAGFSSLSMGTNVWVVDASKEGVALNFDFTGTYVPSTGSGTNLPLSPNTVIKPSSASNFIFGSVGVSNKSQGLFTKGWESKLFNDPIFTPEFHKGGGGTIDFNFIVTAPWVNAANAGFYFAGSRDLGVASWDSSIFGNFDRAYLDEVPIRPTGIAPTHAFGDPVVDHYALKIRPTGESYVVTGTPKLNRTIKESGFSSAVISSTIKVQLKRQYVRPYTISTAGVVFGTQRTYNKNQFAFPATLGALTLYGTTKVTYYARTLATIGAVSSTYGTPVTMLKKRYITYVGMTGTQSMYGTPRIGYGHRNVAPAGVTQTIFGGATVKDKAQNILTLKLFNSMAFGTAFIRDKSTKLFFQSFDTMAFGITTNVIRNPRPIYARPINQYTFDYQRFGTAGIVNRNKTVHAYGEDSSRLLYSYHIVKNSGVPVKVNGTSQTQWGKNQVTYKNRKFYAEACITPEFSVMGQPQFINRLKIGMDGYGWNSMKFSIPRRVYSNAQFVKVSTDHSQTAFGKPWASYGKTYIAPRSISTLPLANPWVSFAKRYVHPEGRVPMQLQKPTVYTHINKIKAWAYSDSSVFGTPTVHNKTPMVFVKPLNSFQAGTKPTVMQMRRYVTVPPAVQDDHHGYQFIGFKNRTVKAQGTDYNRRGYPLVKFDQTQQVPPLQQIFPDAVQMGAGEVVTSGWEDPYAPWSGVTFPMGRNIVKLNTIFCTSIYDFRFGATEVKSMVLVCKPGASTLSWGKPRVWGGTQWLRVSSVPDKYTFGPIGVQGVQYINVGKRHYDGDPPYWEPFSYHTTVPNEYAVYQWNPQTAGPVFGTHPQVQHQHRVVSPYTGDNTGANSNIVSTLGKPRLTPRPQYIRPVGASYYKRGIPQVVRTLDMKIAPFGASSAITGTQIVALQDYGTKWLRPSGWEVSTVHFGMQEVQNQHRRVYPQGVPSFISPKGAQYVGFYKWLYQAGADMSQFGDGWVSPTPRMITQAFVVDDAPHAKGASIRLHHTFLKPASISVSMKFGRPRLTV